MGGRYCTGNNGLKSNLDTWLIVPSIGENTRCLLVIVRERSFGFRLRWRHVLRHCFSSTLHLTQQRASCPNDEYFVDLFKDSSNIIYFESLLRKSRRSQIIPIMQRRFYLRCHGNSQSQWLSTKTTLHHIFSTAFFTVHTPNYSISIFWHVVRPTSSFSLWSKFHKKFLQSQKPRNSDQFRGFLHYYVTCWHIRYTCKTDTFLRISSTSIGLMFARCG